MSWIKEQVEAKRKVEEERIAEQKRSAEAEAVRKKKMRAGAPVAFRKLAEAIVADVEELNKHSKKKFGVRYGEGSQLLEVHHFGELAALLALSLDVMAEKISYRYVSVGQRKLVKGAIQISVEAEGDPSLSFELDETSYAEASRRLLSPIF